MFVNIKYMYTKYVFTTLSKLLINIHKVNCTNYKL